VGGSHEIGRLAARGLSGQFVACCSYPERHAGYAAGRINSKTEWWDGLFAAVLWANFLWTLANIQLDGPDFAGCSTTERRREKAEESHLALEFPDDRCTGALPHFVAALRACQRARKSRARALATIFKPSPRGKAFSYKVSELPRHAERSVDRDCGAALGYALLDRRAAAQGRPVRDELFISVPISCLARARAYFCGRLASDQSCSKLISTRQ
jgi:hypothetical protein